MHLEGQAARSSGAVTGQGGFALAALLVAIGILSIMMLVALPTWRHQAQRDKELELIFRGEQYARAINLYRQKLAGAFPPTLEALVEQKFLRRLYKDPITGEDFLPILANSAAGAQAMAEAGPQGSVAAAPQPGQNPPPGGAGRRGQPMTVPTPDGGGRGRGQSPFPGAGQGSSIGSGRQGGPAAGIIGVMSKSTAQAIRLYNGRDRHDQWLFTYMSVRQSGSPVPGPAQLPAPGTPLPQRGTGPGRGRGPF